MTMTYFNFLALAEHDNSMLETKQEQVNNFRTASIQQENSMCKINLIRTFLAHQKYSSLNKIFNKYV
jgi:hypothetical protein